MKSVRIVKEEVSGHEVIDKVWIRSPFLRRRMWIVGGGGIRERIMRYG